MPLQPAVESLTDGLLSRLALCAVLVVSYHNTEVHFQWDSLGWLAALGAVNGLLLRSSHGSWKMGVLPLMVAAYLLASTIGELLQARVMLNAIQERMRKAEASKSSSSSRKANHE